MYNSLTNGQLAAMVLRIGLGVNMLLHGAVRVPNLSANVEKMAAGFANTILSPLVSQVFLYVLTFAEIIIGLLILVGGPFGRWGYFAGGILMTLLMFGSSLKMDWDTMATQIVYLVAFYLALNHTPNQRA